MITDADHYDFTSGACAILAEVLWCKTGWHPYAIIRGDIAVHAVVQGPDGDFLDVEGWKPADEMLDRWKGDDYEKVPYPLGMHERWTMKRRFNLKGGYAGMFARAAVVAEELLKGEQDEARNARAAG